MKTVNWSICGVALILCAPLVASGAFLGAQTLKHGTISPRWLGTEERGFYRLGTCWVSSSAVDRGRIEPFEQGWKCGVWFVELNYVPN